MNCQQIREQLAFYLEGLTEEEETRIIEDHLAVCSACQKEKEGMEEQLQKLKELPSVLMPDSVQFKMSAAIKEEGEKIRQRRRKKRIFRFSSIAAVFMLGLFSLVMGSQLDNFFYNPEKADETGTIMMKQAEPREKSPENLADPEEGDSTNSQMSLSGGGAQVDPPVQDVRMMDAPDGLQEEPEAVMMLTAPSQPVDLYLELLAVELQEQEYRVLDWEEPEPEIFLIHIEIADTTEAGESGEPNWIPVSYQGQEGQLWKIE